MAERAGERIVGEDLYTSLGSATLRMELDGVPLWQDGAHVAVKQLATYFASYLYLPRLRDMNLLANAVMDGISLMTWSTDSFALAEGMTRISSAISH